MYHAAKGDAGAGHVWGGYQGYHATQAAPVHVILSPIRCSFYFSICFFCKVTDDTSRVDGRRRTADEFDGEF
jgi:hypothetical protein